MIAEGAGLFPQLAGLFLAAFGAATLLPFQSEFVFVALQIAGTASLTWLILVASIGNTLGAVVNYVMGRGIEQFRSRRWFPVNAVQLARAQQWYARWGVWTLLLSWAPLGDAFTVAAGIMRTPAWLFLLLVTIAKTGRYIVLAWVTAQATG
ncbi:membrane protein YqaA, SNARE-associated domain [Roseovarius azorensis]|uniref:Membrane protein YqaA, SNARE-associated domain n=1 Tax=Roseovarius azorensis TaxID=1287727 RepID=A0A1H7UF85_9RHOB|nr:YqaA family protein [Roseovarius azorensis]SEL95385.1 membrane protein YqaA, SNARE-associated domain [Roseovarius azorensis]